MSIRIKTKKPTAATAADVDARLTKLLRKHGYSLQSNIIIRWRGITPTLFGGHNGLRHAARRVMEETEVPDLKAGIAAILSEVE